MRNLLPFLIILASICGSPVTFAQQQRINVTFTNKTGALVRYFLTGGNGRECKLRPDKSANWDMSVDPPTPPTVTVHLVGGGDQTFPVKAGGNYMFRPDKDGKIRLTDENQQYRIDVTFTNRTSALVRYYLTGGDGLECELASGESANWAMSVDPPQPPTVTIHEPKGGDQNFPVKNGGRYIFRSNKAGKILLGGE